MSEDRRQGRGRARGRARPRDDDPRPPPPCTTRLGSKDDDVWPEPSRSSSIFGADSFRRGPDFSLSAADSSLPGADSSLRGADSPRRGADSSLRGADSSLRGADSSLRGADSSLRGADSSLRGADSSHRGADSPRRGADSSLRGADSPRRGVELPRPITKSSLRDDVSPLRDDSTSGSQSSNSFAEEGATNSPRRVFGASPFGASPFSSKGVGPDERSSSRRGSDDSGSGSFGRLPSGLPIAKGLLPGNNSVKDVLDGWQQNRKQRDNDTKSEGYRRDATIHYDFERTPDDKNSRKDKQFGGRRQFGQHGSSSRKPGRSEDNDWRRRDDDGDGDFGGWSNDDRDSSQGRKNESIKGGGWRKQAGVMLPEGRDDRRSPNDDDDDDFAQGRNKRYARPLRGAGGRDENRDPERGNRGRERGAYRGGRGGGGRGGGRPGKKLSEFEKIFERLTLGGTIERPVSIMSDRESLKELGTYVQYNVRGTDAAPKPESCVGTGMEPLPGLFANAFATTTPDYTLYQYVVDFNPLQENPRARKQLVFDHVANSYFAGSLQFDGMHGWSVLKLPEADMKVHVPAREPSKGTVALRIRLVGQLPRDSPTVKQMQNILLRKAMCAMGEVQVGRNFYQPKLQRDVRDPNHRLVVWPGFETRIDLFDGGPLLVMDVSHKVLRTDTVMDCINDWAQEALRLEKDPDVHIKSQLVGTSVLTRYNNRHYRVDDIDFGLCPLNHFKKDGENITYVEYFRDRWGLEIHRPESQPLLIHRLKGSEKRAAEARKQPTFTYLVPEFCYMTGLTTKQRADFTLMRNMGEFTRPTPQARVKALLKFNENLRTLAPAKGELDPWGLFFSPELSELQSAKKISPESIYVGDDAAIEPNLRGNPLEWVDWSRQMKSQLKLINPQHLTKWCMLCPKRDMVDAQAFVQCLLRIANPMGIKMDPPAQYDLNDNRVGTYIRALQEIRDEGSQSVQMVMAFIPKSTELYNAIKTRLCIEMPTPSQCICVGKNLKDSRKALSIATKIAIQMNVKLGGEAWAVSIPPNQGKTCKLMVMGIDTYHDPRHREPSVVGVVASMNKTLTKYLSIPLRQQTTKNEVAEALRACMHNILEHFVMANGHLPDYCCVFRDGVGEGQLQVVHDQEVKAIVEGLDRACKNDIKVSFTVVTKRVPHRFFQKTKNGQFVNPYPGTIVDSVVTRPEYNDFFLVSQSVNQGTVSPTHYNLIYDSTGWKTDIHQRLAYKLTHLYYNWQGTIKVPAPCQYAHKLAYLVGENLKTLPAPMLSTKLYYL